MQFDPINHSAIWAQLHQHQRATRYVHMRDLFEQDPQRFAHMHLALDGLLLDYSKNRLTEHTLGLLVALAKEADLGEWMQRMRSGDKINLSENRAVLHTALRAEADANIAVDGINVVPKVHAALQQALAFAERIRSGDHQGFTGKAIKEVVNIGIGGSDLGPYMVTQALKPYQQVGLGVHFVANVDAADLMQTVAGFNPETTLFIIASKSFTTPETLLNAEAAKTWFLANGGHQAAMAQHFVAVSNNIEAAQAFGIVPEHVFAMFDWVGGRYSSWSTIGLPIMCAIGQANFLDFLAGGRAMDEHFFNAPLRHNMPVLMGLIGLWYNTFYGAHSHAIIPYDHCLKRLPAHIQQLDMESNGKQTGRMGERLDFDTGPIIWGEEGVNCQHAFFQLLHQGSRLVPSDFIIPMNSHYAGKRHHKMLVANAFAQTRALMQGKNEAEVYQELQHLSGIEQDQLAPQKFFPGNQPSNTLLIDKLTPFSMGQLLALYEHKVFVQGVIWGINSFDQWGVEYGKVLANSIEPTLSNAEATAYDGSTNGLIDYFRRTHHEA
ncbi:MAG: glucose-6-phosphate isomerase [Neisseriaceae bacterium]|nr:glucose-6-phosphate isomerase [Neisseriaceae bacterium]